jgi:hypothetical protein
MRVTGRFELRAGLIPGIVPVKTLWLDGDFGFRPVVLQITVHRAVDFFSFLCKIKSRPDADGVENGILGVILPENFKIIRSFLAVDDRFGMPFLDLFKLFIAHLVGQPFSQIFAACTLGVLHLVAP